MVETIKQIGLFMIVAQTFLHFTAGRQYEKYMKIITGVIILLLFVRPFSAKRGDLMEYLQKNQELLAGQIARYGGVWQEELSEIESETAGKMGRRLEEEITAKLNRECDLGDLEITDVTIIWEGTKEEPSVRQIRVTLGQARQRGAAGAIEIEEIQIGKVTGTDRDGEGGKEEAPDAEQKRRLQAYQSTFAGILGIEDGQVEVVYRGSR